MIFVKKVLLGSLSFTTVLIVGNWSGAIAQSLKKSDRHISDQEIQSLEADFQRVARMGGGGGLYRESRKPSEIAQLTNFVDAWQKANSSIAPFLGDWMGFEESLLVYPSINRAQVCVIHRSYGSGGYQYLFNTGKVSGNKLILNGDNGKTVITRKTAPTRVSENSTFLAWFSVFKRPVSAYVFPKPLRNPNEKPIPTGLPIASTAQNRKVIPQFYAAGCTASLPSQVQFNR